MITHPTTEELVESVRLWIDQIRPGLDPRNAFLARVAANALAAVGRELSEGPAAEAEAVRLMAGLLGHEGTFEALNAELCAAIRGGDMTVETAGLLPALHVMAKHQLAIDQPSYRPEGAGPRP
ncbi:MAG: protein kinase [Phenylobacterium sp.]|uniref:DUF6285 domain-containing protein n=1 Tax=Phenylobacterium sp. TaxID=1871053 RepID=UPI0025FB8CBA|nr:DUF6285 domain-containing protein [Phenylobacterium sp.]MBI1200109.1 protein kinase [Phenylobacterium sp.]